MISGSLFIFVDLDGVLWDSEASHKRAFIDAASEYFPGSSEYFKKSNWGFGLPTEKVFLEYLYSNKIDVDFKLIEALTRTKREFAKKYVINHSVINENLLGQLNQVKELFDCKIALVSASSRENVNGFLGRVSDPKMFEAIISREDSKFTKPSPAPYLRAMKLLNSLPEQSIAIDDSEEGVQSARAAGIGLVIKYKLHIKVLDTIKNFAQVRLQTRP